MLHKPFLLRVVSALSALVSLNPHEKGHRPFSYQPPHRAGCPLQTCDLTDAYCHNIPRESQPSAKPPVGWRRSEAPSPGQCDTNGLVDSRYPRERASPFLAPTGSACWQQHQARIVHPRELARPVLVSPQTCDLTDAYCRNIPRESQPSAEAAGWLEKERGSFSRGVGFERFRRLVIPMRKGIALSCTNRFCLLAATSGENRTVTRTGKASSRISPDLWSGETFTFTCGARNLSAAT